MALESSNRRDSWMVRTFLSFERWLLCRFYNLKKTYAKETSGHRFYHLYTVYHVTCVYEAERESFWNPKTVLIFFMNPVYIVTKVLAYHQNVN